MKSILLVGHRATGKTTIAKGLHAFGFEIFDLDEAIRKRSGKTAHEWVRESEATFRQMEIQTLKKLVDEASERPRVISVGAGCLSFPPEVLVIWLNRDGWERDALTQRDRLRDDLSFQEEVAWMRANREPTWRNRAHLHVNIPPGRAEHRTIEEVGTLIDWLLGTAMSPVARKTWVVADKRTINRALIDVGLFGFAGVEVRDDLISSAIESERILASVRLPDSEWISQHPQASAYDVDIAFLFDLLNRDQLADLEPRPIILSSHPDRVDPLDIEQLVAAGRELESRAPEWARHVVFKYAPRIETFDQLGFARALVSPLVRSGLKTTFLPQGDLAAFSRPVLAVSNFSNYLPSTLNTCRVGGGRPEISPFDFQDWLPFLSGGGCTNFRALIGTDARASQGDVWHRRAAIVAGEARGYLKVDVVNSQSLESCLAQLLDMGVCELSVTSPFKREFTYDVAKPTELGPLESQIISTPKSQIAFANTLAFRDGWEGTETDSIGMRAALAEIACHVEPGSIALIGRGGVSTAVELAIADSDWTLMHHVSAREGWASDAFDSVTLVVNASGSEQFVGAPKSDAWLDLHYLGTRKPDDMLYFTGDRFFEAQAEAQRSWWKVVAER